VELRRLRVELKVTKLESGMNLLRHAVSDGISDSLLRAPAGHHHFLDANFADTILQSHGSRNHSVNNNADISSGALPGHLQLQYHRAAQYDVSANVIGDDGSVVSVATTAPTNFEGAQGNTSIKTNIKVGGASFTVDNTVRKTLVSKLSKDLFGEEDVLLTQVDTRSCVPKAKDTHDNQLVRTENFVTVGDSASLLEEDISSLRGVVDGDRPGLFSGIGKTDSFATNKAAVTHDESSSKTKKLKAERTGNGTHPHVLSRTSPSSHVVHSPPLKSKVTLNSVQSSPTNQIFTTPTAGRLSLSGNAAKIERIGNTVMRKENRLAVADLVDRLESVAGSLEKQQEEVTNSIKDATIGPNTTHNTEMQRLLTMLEDQKLELNKLYQVQQQQLEIAASLSESQKLLSPGKHTKSNHFGSNVSPRMNSARSDSTSSERKSKASRSLSPHRTVSGTKLTAGSSLHQQVSPNVAFFRTKERSRSLSPHSKRRQQILNPEGVNSGGANGVGDAGDDHMDNRKGNSEHLPFYRLDERFRARDPNLHNVYDVRSDPCQFGKLETGSPREISTSDGCLSTDHQMTSQEIKTLLAEAEQSLQLHGDVDTPEASPAQLPDQSSGTVKGVQDLGGQAAKPAASAVLDVHALMLLASSASIMNRRLQDGLPGHMQELVIRGISNPSAGASNSNSVYGGGGGPHSSSPANAAATPPPVSCPVSNNDLYARAGATTPDFQTLSLIQQRLLLYQRRLKEAEAKETLREHVGVAYDMFGNSLAVMNVSDTQVGLSLFHCLLLLAAD
jgi:hypothetical protein